MNVGVFVDVNNLYYKINRRFNNRKLDYQKYLVSVTEGYNLYRAFAYGKQLDNDTSKFISCLKSYGYEPKFQIIERNYQRWFDSSIDLAMDIVRTIEKLDKIIIGSSNINIIPLVKWIKERGIICSVNACMISRQLKDISDKWVEISDDLLES